MILNLNELIKMNKQVIPLTERQDKCRDIGTDRLIVLMSHLLRRYDDSILLN